MVDTGPHGLNKSLSADPNYNDVRLRNPKPAAKNSIFAAGFYMFCSERGASRCDSLAIYTAWRAQRYRLEITGPCQAVSNAFFAVGALAPLFAPGFPLFLRLPDGLYPHLDDAKLLETQNGGGTL